jgi:hypothetical protein
VPHTEENLRHVGSRGSTGEPQKVNIQLSDTQGLRGRAWIEIKVFSAPHHRPSIVPVLSGLVNHPLSFPGVKAIALFSQESAFVCTIGLQTQGNEAENDGGPFSLHRAAKEENMGAASNSTHI